VSIFEDSQPRVEILQPLGVGSLQRSQLELARYPTSAEGREGDAGKTAALMVGVLTLACTAVSVFDLYLLALHAH
jgi:hypothetical protein